jgi:hypothetical protein
MMEDNIATPSWNKTQFLPIVIAPEIQEIRKRWAARCAAKAFKAVWR